jgi:nucleotide-binding universal stress UspA family protein
LALPLLLHQFERDLSMHFRKLLVPYDFSAPADAALRTALDLARQPGGRVTVLHVVSPVTGISDVPMAATGIYVDPKDLIAGAKVELERRVTRILGKKGGPKVDIRVEIGSPHQTIVQRSAGMDAIVMSTAGRTGLPHLLIGSVAERVVRHASVPVLTLRPKLRKKPPKR